MVVLVVVAWLLLLLAPRLLCCSSSRRFSQSESLPALRDDRGGGPRGTRCNDLPVIVDAAAVYSDEGNEGMAAVRCDAMCAMGVWKQKEAWKQEGTSRSLIASLAARRR